MFHSSSQSWTKLKGASIQKRRCSKCIMREKKKEREKGACNLERKTVDRAGYIRNGLPGISNGVCELRPGFGL